MPESQLLSCPEIKLLSLKRHTSLDELRTNFTTSPSVSLKGLYVRSHPPSVDSFRDNQVPHEEDNTTNEIVYSRPLDQEQSLGCALTSLAATQKVFGSGTPCATSSIKVAQVQVKPTKSTTTLNTAADCKKSSLITVERSRSTLKLGNLQPRHGSVHSSATTQHGFTKQPNSDTMGILQHQPSDNPPGQEQQHRCKVACPTDDFRDYVPIASVRHVPRTQDLRGLYTTHANKPPGTLSNGQKSSNFPFPTELRRRSTFSGAITPPEPSSSKPGSQMTISLTRDRIRSLSLFFKPDLPTSLHPDPDEPKITTPASTTTIGGKIKSLARLPELVSTKLRSSVLTLRSFSTQATSTATTQMVGEDAEPSSTSFSLSVKERTPSPNKLRKKQQQQQQSQSERRPQVAPFSSPLRMEYKPAGSSSLSARPVTTSHMAEPILRTRAVLSKYWHVPDDLDLDQVNETFVTVIKRSPNEWPYHPPADT